MSWFTIQLRPLRMGGMKKHEAFALIYCVAVILLAGGAW